jgi:hypothetical protein
MPHLFEFMDLAWLPASVRTTLREILECGNARPFRPYYAWVADSALRTAKEGRFHTIVELGAGTGPITRHMAKDPRSNGLRLVVCDSNPDLAAYKVLESDYPGKVVARYDAVDFSKPQPWETGTLLILSATLHHIPSRARGSVMAALAASGCRVMVFEPLRKTALSVLFVFLSTVPAVLLPVLFLTRPGRLRRLFWCWLVPVAPLMFWWDGVITCIRQWTQRQWRWALDQLPKSKKEATVNSWLFCQEVVF